jgi:hypothetical protein
MRYDAEHHDDHLYIVTNKDNSKNNKLMKISLKEIFVNDERGQVCMYICVYIYVHICIYICINTYAYKYIYI